MTTNTAVFSFENVFSAIKRFVSPLNCIMFQFDTNGIVISVEGNSFSLIGRKPEELIGKSLFEVYKEVPSIIDAIHKALSGELSEVTDWLHSRFFNIQLLPIRNENTVIGVAGFALDETPKILDLSNVKENEQDNDSWFYSCFLELPEAMQLVRDGRIVLCNDMAQKLFQYSERDIPVGDRIAECIHQWASKIEKYRKNLTLEEIEAIINDAEQGNTRQFEQDGILPDGNVLAVRTTIYPLRFKGIPHLLFFSQNITLFLEAQRQEAFINNLFNSIQDGIIYIDRNMKVQRFNNVFFKMFPNADFEKSCCYNIFRGKENVCDDCPALQTFQDGLEHSLSEHLDSDRWVETTSFPIYDNDSEKIIGAILLLHDVTEQHHQSALLEQREKIFAAVINSSNDGILTRSDIDNGSTYNPRFVEMFDGNIDTHVTESITSAYKRLKQLAVNADEIVRAQEQLLQTLEPQKGTLRLRDGRVYEWRVIAVNTGIGTTGQTRIWKFHDVTEIHRNTEIIHHQKEEYRLLFESMTNGMLLADVIRGVHGEPINYIIADINPSFAAITNKLPSELIGCSILGPFRYYLIISVVIGGKVWTKPLLENQGLFIFAFPKLIHLITK
jgi:PAS domain-containing protein